jgi:hypothetical protein
MMHRVATLCALAVALVHAPEALAQEGGQVGVTMGYPQSIGLVIHMTDRVAVRPEFNFRHTSNDDDTLENSSTTLGVGIAGLFYLTKFDALRTYASGRYTYAQTSATLNPWILAAATFPVGRVPDLDATTSTWSVSGSFGAQYALHRRFSLFGEVGLSYSGAELSASTLLALFTPNVEATTIATTTAAGVIFYLKD